MQIYRSSKATSGISASREIVAKGERSMQIQHRWLVDSKKYGMWLSFLCLGALLIRVDGALKIGCIVMLAILLVPFVHKLHAYQWKVAALRQKGLAFLLSVCYVGYFVFELEKAAPFWMVLGLLGFPSMCLSVLYILERASLCLKEPVQAVKNSPIRWLLLLMAAAIVLTYTQTTLFYRPMMEGNLMRADRVFTTDTGVIVDENAWLNIESEENDFRQPLFAVFAMPFSIPLFCLGKLVPFFPDFYIFAMALVQWGLLIASYAMLCNIAQLENQQCSGLLLVLVLCYPTLIFMLNLEQYVFSVFWMVAFLYAGFHAFGGRRLLCVAAAGSLLTSGLWEPLVMERFSLKVWLKQSLHIAMMAVFLFVASGKLSLLEVLGRQSQRYANYFGNTPFGERLLQYVNFVGSCLVAPQTRSHDINGTWLLERVTSVNWIGILVLVLATAGIVLFWKQKRLVRFCAVWMAFSFVLLCLLGWGSAENGMILYTLYFGWAFLIPGWLAAWRITQRLGRFQTVFLCGIGLAVLAVNGLDLLGLLRFARRIYPR